MSDTLDDEPDTTVIIAGGIPGPVTLVKVVYCGKAEVMMTVNRPIFDEMREIWAGLAKKHGGDRDAVKNAIIHAFNQENYLSPESVNAIVGAALYVAATGDKTGRLVASIKSGGMMIVARLDKEGFTGWRFRVEMPELG